MKKTRDVAKKRHFITTDGKLQGLFRSGLNEMK